MTELLNVWLDDIRPAPEGWIPARTPDEVISHLRTGKVVEISLDYELNLPGDPQPCGADVLRWIKRHLDEHPDYEPPTAHLHTACPFGRTEMNDILHRINAVLIRRSWGADVRSGGQNHAESG